MEQQTNADVWTKPAEGLAPAPRFTKQFAYASLCFGALALVFVCCDQGVPWIICALLGVVVGHVARWRSRKAAPSRPGRRIALAGIISGYVSLAFYGLLFAFYGLLFVFSQLIAALSPNSNGGSSNVQTTASAPASQIARTHEYLKSLLELDHEWSAIKQPDSQPMTDGHFDQYASQLFATADRWIVLAERVRSLSPLGVDADAVQYGLHTADLLAEVGANWRNRAQYVRAIGRFQENHASGQALLESFVRGAIGDSPLNLYNEAKSDQQRIERIHELLTQREAETGAKASQLDSARARLHATLTQRYGVEF